jgi:hypothetical protein
MTVIYSAKVDEQTTVAWKNLSRSPEILNSRFFLFTVDRLKYGTGPCLQVDRHWNPDHLATWSRLSIFEFF